VWGSACWALVVVGSPSAARACAALPHDAVLHTRACRIRSRANPRQTPHTTQRPPTDIKWLGVRPSDLDRFNIPQQCRLAMTDEDIKTGKKLVRMVVWCGVGACLGC
jgi:hypothetical protein